MRLATGILVAMATALTCAEGGLHHPRWRPAVFAPPAPPHATLLHDSITYSLRPDALQPDDALDVAQFHSQDSAGRVVFGFNTPDQSRVEARSLDGSVRGSYSYQDPTGKIVQVHYWDDGDGFHVSGNNLPYHEGRPQPAYTAEVEAARRHHMRLFQQALHAHSADEHDSEESVGPEAEDKSDTEADEEAGDERPMSDYDDSVAVESAAFSANIRAAPPAQRQRPGGPGEPEAGRKQVALQATDLLLDSVGGGGGGLVLARTGPDGFQYLVPIAPWRGGSPSESRHAALYGAVPVDAVHDAQVSPTQRTGVEVDSHQLKPLLLRTRTG